MSDFTQHPFAGRPPQYAHDDVNPYPREMRAGSRPYVEDERQHHGTVSDLRDVYYGRSDRDAGRNDFGAGGGFSPTYREEHPDRLHDARRSHDERRWRQGSQAPQEPEGFYPYEVAEGYEPQGRRTSPSVGQYDSHRDEFRPMGGGESASSIEGGQLRGSAGYGSPPRSLGEAPYRQQSRSAESGAGRWMQWAKRAPQHRTFGKCPRNYRRSEARICEDISEHIMREPSIDASDVEIDVHGQEVTLEGSVPDHWMKRCIEELAQDALTVDHVENRLRVRKRMEVGRGGPGAGLQQR